MSESKIVGLTLLLAVTAAVPAAAQVDWSEGRRNTAVRMCQERAAEIIRDRGAGREVEVDEITRADEDNDRVKVEGYLRYRDRDDDRRSARMDCEVNFEGNDRITAFDEEGLLDSDRDRDRDRDRNGDLRRQAGRACERLAEDQGYEVADLRDQERSRDGMRMEMRLRRDDRRFEAVCVYDRDRESAAFIRLEPRRD
jgi:hypothetical protein